jgi:hypothetical protein
MTRLSQIQDDFQRYLLRGDGDIENHVVGTERVPIATRLGIYGGGYGARLTEALQTNFPVLSRLLGETDFEAMAAAYIRAHDSTYRSIRYYGDALEQFLAKDPTYAAAPVLAELARWEWAMTETFDAADAPALDVSAMANVSAEHWSDLRFDWHPSIRRLQLLWNVAQIWSAITKETPPPEPSLSTEAGQWLMWRRDTELQIYFRSLTASEAAALDAARGGGSFGEVCDLLCGLVDEAAAPAHAAGYLREWLQSGLIVRLDSALQA